MEYRLMSNGRLVEGTDEAEAIHELSRVTGVPENHIREKLLSNHRVKLKSSTDKKEIKELYQALIEIGLDVELEKGKARGGKGGAKRSSGHGAAKTSRQGWVKKSVIGLVVFLLLLTGGAGTYIWYLTRAPYPALAQDAESALADGNLVAIGYANVDKLMKLNQLAFGSLDPAALPVGDAKKDVVSALLDGPADLRARLDQLLVGVYAPEEKIPGKSAVFMLGEFNRQAVLETYRQYYELTDIKNTTHWKILGDKKAAGKGGEQCPDQNENTRSQKPSYLFVDSKIILLIDDQDHGKQLVKRYRNTASESQDLAQWRNYRQGKLASLMVMSLPETGQSLGGMQGMMINRAGSQNSEIKSVAAGLSTDLISLGMNVDLALFSDDKAWNAETSSSIRKEIAKIKQDTRRVTPSVSRLMSRVRVASGPESLNINIKLDKAVLDNIANVVQESLASFMGASISDSGENGPIKEQVQANPKNYSANNILASLPPLKIESYENVPLFSDKAFGVDLKNIRMKDDDVLEMQIQGKVSLPNGDNSYVNKNSMTGELALQVDSVTNAQGENLLRDEQCITPNELFGRMPNHKPETTSLISPSQVVVSKYVRLKPGLDATDIEHVRGTIRFSAPVSIREFSVPLKAGETVNESGMRFYVTRITDNSVSYQLTGEQDRLLEVRALNKDGKALKKQWRISSGDDGRVTQNYQGKVHAIKIFVATKFAVHKTSYQLDDLFVASKDSDEASPQYFAPEQISPEQWDDYRKIDMRRAEYDPGKWNTSGGATQPIAEEHWRGLSMYMTHAPSEWGNSPWAHIYFPMLYKLPSVLSAFSYHVEEPAVEDAPEFHYVRISYPYSAKTGEVIPRDTVEGMPIAIQSLLMKSGLEKNRKLKRIKGKLVFRLPIKTALTTMRLSELWQGRTEDGVTVTLTGIERGMFPGYNLKIEGDIDKLVNLHGLDSEGKRVIADPINYQDAGYWTMTLPFGKGIDSVELVLAEKQETRDYPFDLKPAYHDSE